MSKLAIFLSVLTIAQSRMLSQEHRDRLSGLTVSDSVGKDTFCTNPVSKKEVIFPESIVGRAKINFDMYSGYVNVTSDDYLFYWFFSNQDKASNPDAPLIIWTNGGPGCTSMEGATTETGPLSLFDIKESCSNAGADSKCDYTGQLSSNAYAWNAHSNLLFLDQPKSVGFSFGSGPGTKSSEEAADDFIIFYQNWLGLFPEFKGRELIIAGESYGGHYVPAWANAILNFNDAAADTDKINFSGVVIGNGCVNDLSQSTEAFVEFQHENNLIPSDSNPKTQAMAEIEMVNHIGYTPNYYDFRTESISCSACYGYNYTAWAYWFLQNEVLEALNVCGDAGNDAFAGAAGGCIGMGNFDANSNFDFSGAIGRTLDAGVPVTFYFGKTDTACNYKGGIAMADTIEWSGRESFASSEFTPYEISGVEAGQVKTSGGLTFLQIDGAGHMVPLDQPAGSAAALQSILARL